MYGYQYQLVSQQHNNIRCPKQLLPKNNTIQYIIVFRPKQRCNASIITMQLSLLASLLLLLVLLLASRAPTSTSTSTSNSIQYSYVPTHSTTGVLYSGALRRGTKAQLESYLHSYCRYYDRVRRTYDPCLFSLPTIYLLLLRYNRR